MDNKEQMLEVMRQARKEERREQTWRTIKFVLVAIVGAILFVAVGGIVLSRLG